MEQAQWGLLLKKDPLSGGRQNVDRLNKSRREISKIFFLKDGLRRMLHIPTNVYTCWMSKNVQEPLWCVCGSGDLEVWVGQSFIMQVCVDEGNKRK